MLVHPFITTEDFNRADETGECPRCGATLCYCEFTGEFNCTNCEWPASFEVGDTESEVGEYSAARYERRFLYDVETPRRPITFCVYISEKSWLYRKGYFIKKKKKSARRKEI